MREGKKGGEGEKEGRKRKKIKSSVCRYKEGEGSGELPECGGELHSEWPHQMASSLLPACAERLKTANKAVSAGPWAGEARQDGSSLIQETN